MATTEKNIKVENELYWHTFSEYSWDALDDIRPYGFTIPEIVITAYAAYLKQGNDKKSLEELLAANGFNVTVNAYISAVMDDEHLECAEMLAEKYSAEQLVSLFAIWPQTAAQNQGRIYGGYVTPGSLIYLALALLDIRDGESFAEFGCGWGSLLSAANIRAPKASCFGLEINPEAAAIAAIRTSVLGCSAEIALGDMLSFDVDRHFDKVFVECPFGMSFKALNLEDTPYEDMLHSDVAFGKPANAAWVYARRLCDSLTKDGRGIALMASGPTSNYNDNQARRHFIENGQVEAVIALPIKLFSYTNVATTLVVFGHNESGSIRMIDASDFSINGRRWNTMGSDEIEDILSWLDADSAYSKLVSNEEIAEHDYSLAPATYLRNLVTFENAAPLSELVTTIERGISIKAAELDELIADEHTEYNYLALSDVADGRVGSELPYLEDLDAKYKRAFLQNGDVVLTKIGATPRAAVAEVPEGQHVLVSGNLYIVRFDTKKIDPYYAAAFFASVEGREVLESQVKGTTIPTLSMRDLQSLEIPVLPMEKQLRIAEAYRSALDEYDALKIRLKEVRASIANAYAEGVEL